MIPDFAPSVRFHTFGESSIDLTVIMRGNEFTDQFLIKHEFIKRIHERFAKEGIVISYPIRALNFDQEKRDEEGSAITRRDFAGRGSSLPRISGFPSSGRCRGIYGRNSPIAGSFFP